MLHDFYRDGINGENCGAPVVDIAPFKLNSTYYALAWIQLVDQYPLPNPPRLWDVYFVDTISNIPVRVARPGSDGRNKTLPSVACHYWEYNGEPYASVSMYEAGVGGADYRPTACQIAIDDTSPFTAPTMSNWNTIPVDCGQSWVPGSILRADNGVCTNIVMMDGNYYFMGFSDTIASWPRIVYAAYGNTE